MAETVTADDGTQFAPANLPVVINWASATQVNYIQVEYPPASGKFYRQTFTYTSNLITNVTGWVKQ